jgi:hypothetical protein
MTIRQLLLAANAAAAGAGISLKGTATAETTSVSLPTHAANDMIVIVAGGNDIPSIPSGWEPIESLDLPFGGAKGMVCAYKLAASGAEASGTWAGADMIIAAVYDGVASIGGKAQRKSTSTVTYPGITMSVSNGSSWVVGVGLFNGGTSYTTPPTGMTHRAGVSGSLGLHDTAAGTSSWGDKGLWSGVSSCGAITFELVAE